MMREKDAPIHLVDLWTERFPSCYRQMNNMSGAKIDDPTRWPDYCPIPINAAYTLLTVAELDDHTAAAFAAELTACWAWMKNKIIYAFDPYLTDALAIQGGDFHDTKDLPVDLLFRLPYPCFYVKAPIMAEPTDGFFAWIDWDLNQKVAELRIQLVTKDFTHSIPQALCLVPGATIKECAEATIRTHMKNRTSSTTVMNRFPLCAENRWSHCISTVTSDFSAHNGISFALSLQLQLYGVKRRI